MSKSEAKKRAVRQADRNRPREKKPLSKTAKILLWVAAAILVLAAIAAGILGYMRHQEEERRAATTVVGFYDLDAAYVDSIRQVLDRYVPETTADGTPAVVQFIQLTDADMARKSLTQDVDLLFTRTGAQTAALKDKALPLSETVESRFANSIRTSTFYSNNGAMYAMPVFFDHFETACFSKLLSQAGTEMASDLTGFAQMLQALKQTMTYPLICAGADDTALFSFISVIAESIGGASGYTQLVADLQEAAASAKNGSLDSLLNVALKGDAPEGLVFGDILQVIKMWQADGLLIGNWYEVKEATVKVFMEDNHAAVIEMLLSQHRNMPYSWIKYYEAVQFPYDTSLTRSIVAPSCACLTFRRTEATDLFAEALSSADEQDYLSSLTKLAPATLRGQSYDIQADDVRFLCAANPGGPVPELGTAVFALAENRAEFAEWIREQLKSL